MDEQFFMGKTLAELSRTTDVNFGGYAVFVLRDSEDMLGDLLCESFSIKDILSKHPFYANHRVRYCNYFFGETTLRVEGA